MVHGGGGGASYYIGGIVGALNGVINNCYADADVTFINAGSAISFVGGGFGGIETGSVSDTYSNCNIKVNDNNANAWVGGFAGFTYANCTNCYATGTIYDLLAASTAVEFQYSGGFVARTTDPIIAYCYAAMGPWSIGLGVGRGFMGYSSGSATLTDCFWDTTVAGFSMDDTNATETTTAELMTTSTYNGTGWDFASQPEDGTEDVWWMPVKDYPKLTSQGCPFNIPADINNDCKVNLLDLAIIAESWQLDCFAIPENCLK